MVRRSIARKKLDWRTGNECLFGETTDISLFRFKWFCPIWYYNPSIKMPKYKMLKGFFLGIEENVGDFFTYQILPEEKLKKGGRCKHLSRSVVRLRDVDHDGPPPFVQDQDGTLVFTDIHGKELVGDSLEEAT